MTISDACIFLRRSKNGRKTYYVQLRNPDTWRFEGGRMLSVNMLARKMDVIVKGKLTRPDATEIVRRAIEKGLIYIENDRSPELVDYVEHICTYDISPWVSSEAKRTKSPLSRNYVSNLLRSFQLHASRFIPRHTKLSAFSRADALALQEEMNREGLSPDRINTAFKALRTAYNYALMTGLVEQNPIDALKPVTVQYRERVILSRSEVSRVLAVMERHAPESTARRSAYLSTKLAVHSGMREGEIRGLRLNRISRIKSYDGKDTGYFKIVVDTAWKPDIKALGPTKGKYKRNTVITSTLAQELFDFAEDEGRSADGLLFKGDEARLADPGIMTPVSKTMLCRYLYEALAEIGIDEKTRKERGIDFHSLRHFYDSETKAVAQGMDTFKSAIRSAVGHRSKNVDELIYTHDTLTTLVMLGIMSEHMLDEGVILTEAERNGI